MRMAHFAPSCAISGALLGIVLGGCSLQLPKAAPEASVSAARPADQLVGKNLDTLIAKLGQPDRSRQSDDGQTSSYMWEIEPREALPPTGAGGLYGDANNPNHVSEGYSPFCKITVVVSLANSNIIQASTEESKGTAASSWGSNICSRYLREKSLS